MKVYIFGKSRGLGYELGQLFEKDGYQVVGFDRSNGFDIEHDWPNIVSRIEDDSLIILNAYANGCQKQILENLVNKKNKIVVMGSIASKYLDPTMPVYSNHKMELDKYFMKVAIEKKESDLLMLTLTGKSYQTSKLIYESIKFWLLNTDIIEFSYRIK
jgi:short-subunit dehydrogenase